MAAVTAMVSWFDARIYTNMKKMRCGRSNDSNTECITQVLPGPWSTSPLPCALSTFASVVEYRKGKINYAKYLSSPATCEHTHTHTYILYMHAISAYKVITKSCYIQYVCVDLDQDGGHERAEHDSFNRRLQLLLILAHQSLFSTYIYIHTYIHT